MKINFEMIKNVLKNYIYADTSDDFLDFDDFVIITKETIYAHSTLYILPKNFRSTPQSMPNSSAIICFENPNAGTASLVLNSDTDEFEVINLIQNTFKLPSQIENTIMSSIYKGTTVQAVLEAYLPLVKNQIQVITDAYKMIGCINGDSKHQNENYLSIPSNIVECLENDITFLESRRKKGIFTAENKIFPCKTLCSNIFINGDFFGRIIMLEDKEPFHSYDKLILEELSEYISLMLSNSTNGILFSSENHLEYLLKMLLSSTAVDEKKLSEALKEHGFQANDNFYCVHARPVHTELYHHTLSYHCDMLNKHKCICAFEHESEIFILTDKPCLSHVFKFLPANAFIYGVSNSFANINDLISFCNQSREALRIGTAFSKKKSPYIFSELIFDYISDKCSKDFDKTALCSPKLLLLKAYDKANSSHYVETLQKLLDNEMNIVKTAKELFIHRATMIYRFKRIKEISSINFESIEEKLYIRLSLKLLENDL